MLQLKPRGKEEEKGDTKAGETFEAP